VVEVEEAEEVVVQVWPSAGGLRPVETVGTAWPLTLGLRPVETFGAAWAVVACPGGLATRSQVELPELAAVALLAQCEQTWSQTGQRGSGSSYIMLSWSQLSSCLSIGTLTSPAELESVAAN
jgi:hypothetical protein